MTTKKLTIGLAAIAASAVLAPATAFGSAAHAGAAALSTAQDEIQSRSADAGDDITCQPQADGTSVTPETNFVVGKIFAQDLGIGQAKCISLNAKTYTMRLTTKIQWFNGTTWYDVPGCYRSQNGTVTNGVGVVPALQVTCNYGDASPYLDKYHRAYSILTNSVDAVVRTDPSATWYQRRG